MLADPGHARRPPLRRARRAHRGIRGATRRLRPRARATRDGRRRVSAVIPDDVRHLPHGNRRSADPLASRAAYIDSIAIADWRQRHDPHAQHRSTLRRVLRRRPARSGRVTPVFAATLDGQLTPVATSSWWARWSCSAIGIALKVMAAAARATDVPVADVHPTFAGGGTRERDGDDHAHAWICRLLTLFAVSAAVRSPSRCSGPARHPLLRLRRADVRVDGYALYVSVLRDADPHAGRRCGIGEQASCATRHVARIACPRSIARRLGAGKCSLMHGARERRSSTDPATS